MQSSTAVEFDTSTIIGSEMTLSTLLPVSFNTHGNCTLNSQFNVHATSDITTAPKMRYFGIGTGGCYNADSGYVTSVHMPQRINLNLYNQIPIRCRPTDEDLSEAERSKYRMRVEQTINGIPYYCYYLKMLEFIGDIQYRRINPQTNEEELYELNPSNLSPVPPDVSADGTIITDTSRVIVYQQARVEILATEVLEYIRAKYGDDRYAKISELGMFTGVDQTVSGYTNGATPITYQESIYTTMYAHKTWIGTPTSSPGQDINSIFRIYGNGAITKN